MATAPDQSSVQAPGEMDKKSWLESHEAGYHKTLGNRQVQMIAIGGAIGTGLFLGAGARANGCEPARSARCCLGCPGERRQPPGSQSGLPGGAAPLAAGVQTPSRSARRRANCHAASRPANVLASSSGMRALPW